MKLHIAIALLVTLIGCGQGPVGNSNPVPNSSPSVSQTETAIPDSAGLKLASAITNGNVTVYPVVSTNSVNRFMDDMVTLDEARKNGWVDIIEQEDETVEVLQVINKGPKPIFLMAGEVLLGGKQDRIIAEDTIVKPGQTADVKVFCVDQGRWSGGEHFKPSAMQAPRKVKEAAMLGKDQGKVWENVAEANQYILAYEEPSSPSLSAGSSLKRSVDSKALKARQADSAKVAADVMKHANVVGLVTVVNGKIAGFEYFGSNKFFGKALPSLLNGVLADSLLVKSNEAAGNAGAKEAAAFVADCLKSKAVKNEVGAGGYGLSVSEGRRGRGTSTKAPGSAAGEGLVRGSYFSKD